jgi:hypothetical protein
MEPNKPERLAELFDCELVTQSLWSETEFAAILRHLMEVPLRASFGDFTPSGWTQQSETGVAWAEMTCLEVFSASRPPLAVLVGIKEFAKMCRDNPAGPLPPEIATVVYFASIAVALLRCGIMITTLERTELLKGLSWTIGRPWLDAKTHSLVGEAKKHIEMSGSYQQFGQSGVA